MLESKKFIDIDCLNQDGIKCSNCGYKFRRVDPVFYCRETKEYACNALCVIGLFGEIVKE